MKRKIKARALSSEYISQIHVSPELIASDKAFRENFNKQSG